MTKLRAHARDHDARSEFERFVLKFSAMTDQGADGSALTAKAILRLALYDGDAAVLLKMGRSAREVQG